jgi:iron complex outermembrane receptor protein
MFRKTAIGTAAALLVGSWWGAALAQDSTQRIEITGTATKRIDAEATLPVTVITKEDIAKTGASTAAELIDRISANNGGGYAQVLAIGDSARPGFAGASLRGLGPGLTLVLLNGRRLAVYAFDGGGTDLNAIALGAIERVEVLRDGASALYGTDAIAGVMNFITRKDFTGIDATAGVRVPQKSGGKATNVSVTGGIGDMASNGFNVFANLTYDDFKALKANQRDFAKTAFLPDKGIDRTSGNTFPASILAPATGTWPAATVNPGVPDCLAPVSFQTTPTGACRFDYASVIDILPPQEKIGGLIRGTLQLGPSHELFAEWNKTRTTTTFNISPTPASAATTFNGDPLLYPAGGPHYPTALNPATGQVEPGLLWFRTPGDPNSLEFRPLSGDLNIFWRTVEGGPRANEAKADQERFLVGAKGTLFGKWDYDTGIMRATSKVTESYVGGLFFESKLLNATCTDTSQYCGPLNPTYAAGTLNPLINPFGPNDAAGLAALRSALVLEPVRISKSTRTSFDGKLSGEIGQLAGGPIAAAVGVERRIESYDDQPQEVLQTGDIIGGGGNQAPIKGSRNVNAVFGELVVPVFKGFEVLAQLRHDKYSDFGSTTNPKVGFRWNPNREIMIRASTGTGFRAPILPDLLSPNTQTNTGDSYNDPFYEARVGDCYENAPDPQNPGQTIRVESANFNPQFCNAQLTVVQGGNRNLEPEESRQTTIGLLFQPTKDIQIEVDLWKYKLKKQIGIPDADARLRNFINPFLTDPNAQYDPTTATLSAAGKGTLNGGSTDSNIVVDADGNLDFVQAVFDNIASSDIRGVDIAINATLARTEMGVFRAGWEATYIDSWKQDGTEFVGQYSQFGPVVRWKHRLDVDWERGPWTVGAAYRWSSGYVDASGDRRVSPYELVDLSLAYKGIKNLTLRAGVDNVFDKDPPFSNQGDYFHVGYDPTYGNPLGRTFRFAVNYVWK